MQSNDIYERFDKIRKQKGLSLYAVAKKASCTSEALYKWRDRKTSPSLYLLECLSYALNIELAELLYDEPILIVVNEIDKNLITEINKLENKDKETLLYYAQTLLENKRT